MSKKFSAQRGTADILPAETHLWQNIERKARKAFRQYNYTEIRTPLFEETGLFQRSLGQTSDVVNKQLLELAANKEEGFALRPEGTAPIVRAYVENSLNRKENISKLFYIGPMLRGERPQKGRLRQFHQIGAEVIGPGAGHPYLDAEVIALNVYLLKSFGLMEFDLKLNTLGTLADKEHFSRILREHLKNKVRGLCEDCRQRYTRNVFRILDCKNKSCRDVILGLRIDHSHLSDESRSYFAKVTQALDTISVTYKICYDLVRGLDYYTHTVFEISGDSLGSQDALRAGGRYNHLVNQLGGADVPDIGFALGIERVILSLPNEFAAKAEPLQVFVIALDEQYLGKAFKILEILRAGGVSGDMSFQVTSVKSQMRQANKSGALTAIILGEEEEKKDMITLKDMTHGDQKQVQMDELINEIETLCAKAGR